MEHKADLRIRDADHSEILEHSGRLLMDDDSNRNSLEHLSKSFEIVHHSIDLRADQHKTLPKQNPMLGYFFMILFVLGVTGNHLFAKLAYFNNPKLTNFWGIVVSPTFITISKLNGYTLSIFSYPKKAILIIVLTVALALAINTTMLYGISLIPVGKSTLVFSLNPIFCILLAHYFLGEKELPIYTTIGAFIGIYFLTINKPDDNKSENNYIIGFACVFLGAWFQASIMITVRILNIYQVHPFFRPSYVGTCFLILTLIIKIVSPSSLMFPEYDFLDIVYLCLSGVGTAVCVGFLNYAFKYQKASKLAPLFYIENLFTLLSDTFIFGYSFVLTDYILPPFFIILYIGILALLLNINYYCLSINSCVHQNNACKRLNLKLKYFNFYY